MTDGNARRSTPKPLPASDYKHISFVSPDAAAVIALGGDDMTVVWRAEGVETSAAAYAPVREHLVSTGQVLVEETRLESDKHFPGPVIKSWFVKPADRNVLMAVPSA